MAKFIQLIKVPGILEDENEWDVVLTEATTSSMPKQLRGLFAKLLIYCEPTDPSALFSSHLHSMAEDFINCFSTSTHSFAFDDPFIIAYIAEDISLHLAQFSKSWTDYNLPVKWNQNLMILW